MASEDGFSGARKRATSELLRGYVTGLLLLVWFFIVPWVGQAQFQGLSGPAAEFVTKTLNPLYNALATWVERITEGWLGASVLLPVFDLLVGYVTTRLDLDLLVFVKVIAGPMALWAVVSFAGFFVSRFVYSPLLWQHRLRNLMRDYWDRRNTPALSPADRSAAQAAITQLAIFIHNEWYRAARKSWVEARESLGFSHPIRRAHLRVRERGIYWWATAAAVVGVVMLLSNPQASLALLSHLSSYAPAWFTGFFMMAGSIFSFGGSGRQTARQQAVLVELQQLDRLDERLHDAQGRVPSAQDVGTMYQNILGFWRRVKQEGVRPDRSEPLRQARAAIMQKLLRAQLQVMVVDDLRSAEAMLRAIKKRISAEDLQGDPALQAAVREVTKTIVLAQIRGVDRRSPRRALSMIDRALRRARKELGDDPDIRRAHHEMRMAIYAGRGVAVQPPPELAAPAAEPPRPAAARPARRSVTEAQVRRFVEEVDRIYEPGRVASLLVDLDTAVERVDQLLPSVFVVMGQLEEQFATPTPGVSVEARATALADAIRVLETAARAELDAESGGGPDVIGAIQRVVELLRYIAFMIPAEYDQADRIIDALRHLAQTEPVLDTTQPESVALYSAWLEETAMQLVRLQVAEELLGLAEARRRVAQVRQQLQQQRPEPAMREEAQRAWANEVQQMVAEFLALDEVLGRAEAAVRELDSETEDREREVVEFMLNVHEVELRRIERLVQALPLQYRPALESTIQRIAQMIAQRRRGPAYLIETVMPEPRMGAEELTELQQRLVQLLAQARARGSAAQVRDAEAAYEAAQRRIVAAGRPRAEAIAAQIRAAVAHVRRMSVEELRQAQGEIDRLYREEGQALPLEAQDAVHRAYAQAQQAIVAEHRRRAGVVVPWQLIQEIDRLVVDPADPAGLEPVRQRYAQLAQRAQWLHDPEARAAAERHLAQRQADIDDAARAQEAAPP